MYLLHRVVVNDTIRIKSEAWFLAYYECLGVSFYFCDYIYIYTDIQRKRSCLQRLALNVRPWLIFSLLCVVCIFKYFTIKQATLITGTKVFVRIIKTTDDVSSCIYGINTTSRGEGGVWGRWKSEGEKNTSRRNSSLEKRPVLAKAGHEEQAA